MRVAYIIADLAYRMV